MGEKFMVSQAETRFLASLSPKQKILYYQEQAEKEFLAMLTPEQRWLWDQLQFQMKSNATTELMRASDPESAHDEAMRLMGRPGIIEFQKSRLTEEAQKLMSRATGSKQGRATVREQAEALLNRRKE